MKTPLPVRYLIIAVLALSGANLYADESAQEESVQDVSAQDEAAQDASAQEDQQEMQYYSFFAAPIVEAMMYGRAPPSIGYGFAIGMEDSISLGLKGIYAMPLERYDLTTLEITIFFRVYLFSAGAASGLFAQLTCGFAVFSWENKIELPAEGGTISFGITTGWRFPLGNHFFIEPYLRGGYPYYGGLGLSAGVRF